MKTFCGVSEEWDGNLESKISSLISLFALNRTCDIYPTLPMMEMQKSQPEKQSPAAKKPPVTSCRKKKSQEAAFLEDVKDHIDEFINASMEEHKTSFKITIQKVLYFAPTSISLYPVRVAIRFFRCLECQRLSLKRGS